MRGLSGGGRVGPGTPGWETALEAQADLALIPVDQTGAIARWPAAAQRLFGWAPADMDGRQIGVLFPESSRVEVAGRLAGAATAPVSDEWIGGLLSRDGCCVPAGVRFLVSDEGRALLIRRRTREAANESGLRAANALLSLTNAATLVLDPGGRILDVGAAWPTPEGSDPASWRGRSAAELLGGDRREVVTALREAARLGRWTGPLTLRGRRTRIELRAVHDEARNLQSLVATGPRAEGDALQIVRAAPVPLLLLDAKLEVRAASVEAAALCGAERPEDLTGLDARSLAMFQVRSIQDALEGMLDGRPLDLAGAALSAPGRTVEASLRGCPIPDGAGAAGHLVAILPRSANAEVERQLMRAHKMESIGNFASGLAHDFGNFVAVILGKTTMLRVKLPEDPHVTRDLDDIETAAKRAQHLSQELMRFARGGRSRVARLDVNELIGAVGSLIQTSVGKRITLDVRLGEGLAPVDGDEVEIQQLILNLCLNARDAMPNGGRLTIETRRASDDQRGRLAAGAEPPEAVSIVVRDTGTGMPPEVLERIFEPFFTTKHDSSKGAGLGLAMVYGIVRRHGGTIDVKSRLAVGTAFEIVLPAATPKKEEAARRATLVVDDEPAFGEMIRLILEEDGHQVKLASNGIEAIRAIQQEHGRLGLVILDLRMPGLDGLGVLDELREIAPGLPVLVTTGYADSEEKQEALRRGARKVLEKPYRVVDLRAALEEVLSGASPAGPAGDPARTASGPAAPRQPSGEVWSLGGGPR